MISVVVISKDEPGLDETLRDVGAQAAGLGPPYELVVVDASEGRLDAVRTRHPGVRWIDFTPHEGVRVSIPHQRNAGVRASVGEIVVFTDAGCRPHERWLARLVAPVLAGHETVAAGVALAAGERGGIYDRGSERAAADEYMAECPTINLAFARAAFDAVGGFDERFEYGSDVDFSWRLGEAGHRIRSVPDAVVEHDWGSARRRLRRSFAYGRARARLYRTHPGRLRGALRRDPMVVVYPLFLLGLPLMWRVRAYPALLLLPAWRNRADGPVRVVVDHLAFGAGVLAEVARR
jgi:glycosyltransferase involved in cell wall biosynthesis